MKRIISSALIIAGMTGVAGAHPQPVSRAAMKHPTTAGTTVDTNVAENIYTAIRQPRVLSSTLLPSGLREYILADESGHLFKSYSDPTQPKFNTRSSLRLPRNEEQAQTGLAESFEAWDGKDTAWLPDGWELQSTAAKYSWQPSGTVGFYRPTHGKYQAYIPFASANQISGEQNERLVSPEFIVPEGAKLYADLTLSLFSIYDPQYFDPATKTFSKRRVTATMSVMVEADGVWEEVFNTRDLAAQLEDEDLYENHSAPEIYTLRQSLARFAGKQVRVAFVYKGVGGNSMAIDYIAVQQAVNMAIYHRPSGYFFEGMNEFYNADQNFASMVGPAFTEADWYSLTLRDVQSVEWAFTDPDNLDASFTIGDWIGHAPEYPYCWTLAPKITAKSDGSQPLTYQYDVANEATGVVKYGGGGSDILDGEFVEYGCGSYNWRCGLQAPIYSYDAGAYLFGAGSNEGFWNPSGINLLSIASYYEKPLAPYFFDKAWISVNDLDADDDAEFTLRLWEITDEGNLEEKPFSTSTIRTTDILKFQSGESYLYSLVFPFEPTTIDHAMLVELVGFMDEPKVRIFSPLCQGNPHVDAESNGYMIYSKTSDPSVVGISATSQMLREFYCPFIMTMNATYSFLLCNEDKFHAPADGGSHDFDIYSYFTTDSWEVDENIPDWVTELDPRMDANGEMHLHVTVDALPDGVKGRYWDFTLRIPGASKRFRIGQGDLTAVDAIIADGGVAEVFDMTGISRGRFELDSNRNLVGTDALPKGVYILRLSNGETLKIMK